MKPFLRYLILGAVFWLGTTSPCLSKSSAPPNLNPILYTPAPFNLVSPPNPKLKQMVMAIVPTRKRTTLVEAAGLAIFAARQFRQNLPEKEWQVFVFSNNAAARRFDTYQRKRNRKPLQEADYRALVAIWPQCLACYHLKNGREFYKYPLNAPQNWWR